MTIKSSTVLVVDDIETNREILKRRLQQRNFVVTTAEGGIQALAMLAENIFDIVLLDIMMPDFSGIETLREIRANPLWQHLPVIMVTAKDDADILQECLEIGANDYVSKPVNISILIARIRSQLSRKWAMDAIAQTQIMLEEKVEKRTDELLISIKNLKQGVIERDQAIFESKRAKTRLMDAIKSLSDGFALFDADLRLQLTNDKFYEMYELSPEQAPIGSSYEEILRKVAEKHVMTEAVGREDLWIREQLDITEKESEESTVNGRWIRMGQRKTTEGGLVGIYSDITTQKKNEEILRELSLRDHLTGLYNRRHFMKVLEAEIDRWRRYETTLSLMVLDIDFFKQINDTYGHETGDQVLKVISTQMTELTRLSDTVSRWGGDEFVILLPNTVFADACLLAERIRNAISQSPLIYDEELLSTTVSIGVAAMNDQLANGEEFLNQADLALFRGKKSGRNKVCI